jgi:hypothetical protein
MFNVILSIDERLDDVKRCVESLRSVYGKDTRIALVTYGGKSVGKQPRVLHYALSEGLIYYSCDRHDWLTDEDRREWHACEILARMQITREFSKTDSEIYIMHADVIVQKDFRSYFVEKCIGKWSFVAILLRAKEDFKTLCDKGSWNIYFEGNKARLADIITLYNPEFVKEIYDTYGEDKDIWDKLLSKFTLAGDLAQFDLARERNGYTGRYIQEENDWNPMLSGAVVHKAREKMPEFLPPEERKGLTVGEMNQNFVRRVLGK